MSRHVKIASLRWLVFACLFQSLVARPGPRQLHEMAAHTREAARPTPNHIVQAQISRVTQPPSPVLARLQGRQDGFSKPPDICGWSQADGVSFTCVNAGATCSSESGYFDCCEPGKDCNFKTTCLNYSASEAGECDSVTDYSTLCCATSSMGDCATLFLSGGGAFSQFICDSTSGADLLLITDPRWKTNSSSTPPTSTSTLTRSPSPDPEPTDDEPSVGAIAGGTVGGVAILAIVGLGVFMYLRRRKQRRQAEDAAGQATRQDEGDDAVGTNKPELEASSGTVFTGGFGAAHRKSELNGSTNAISEMHGSEAIYEMPGSEFRGWELAGPDDNKHGDERAATPADNTDAAMVASGNASEVSERPKIRRKPLTGSSHRSST